MPEPANDDGSPIRCSTCGAEGELTAADGALHLSEGFEMVDGTPMCRCGGMAGIALPTSHG